jgi:hypothetical protein
MRKGKESLMSQLEAALAESCRTGADSRDDAVLVVLAEVPWAREALSDYVATYCPELEGEILAWIGNHRQAAH